MEDTIFLDKGQILTIIKEWRKHDVLYKVKHPKYGNKHYRDKAIRAINNVLKLRYPKFNGSDALVKEKIEILRVQYLRELNRSKGDPNYTPTLFCFRELDFLRSMTVIGLKKANGESILRQASTNNSENLLSADVEINNSNSSLSSSSSYSNEFRLKNSNDAADNALRAANAALHAISNNCDQISVDSSFAQYVKHEMMMLRNDAVKASLRERIISIIMTYKLRNRIQIQTTN